MPTRSWPARPGRSARRPTGPPWVLVGGVADRGGAPVPVGNGSRSPAGMPRRRSGPSAAVITTSTRLPTRRSSGRCTMPSISGASCTVRPCPVVPTRTRRTSPMRRSRSAAVMASWNSGRTRELA